MKNHLLIVFGLMGALASCAPAAKLKMATPDQMQADSIYRSIAKPVSSFITKVTGANEASVIYGFEANKDSALVKVSKLYVNNGIWTISSCISFPDGGDDGYVLTGISDSISAVSFEGIEYFSFEVSREAGANVQKAVLMYRSDTETMSQICFTGSKLADGKIEGTDNYKLNADSGKEYLIWALDQLKKDPSLVFLAEGDIMTDQAIRWWNSKNPSALKGAKKITFGQLEDGCSLIDRFAATEKENGSAYKAAMFNYRGYTCIVSFRKSTGTYSLVWAEPECKNKKTDRLLNTIYFSSGSNLSMFYYQGNRTFKYILNLGTGALEVR